MIYIQTSFPGRNDLSDLSNFESRADEQKFDQFIFNSYWNASTSLCLFKTAVTGQCAKRESLWMLAVTHPPSTTPELNDPDPDPSSLPPHGCCAACFHLLSSALPSRTSWISLASRVSYMSRASARFLCSLEWDFSRALARSYDSWGVTTRHTVITRALIYWLTRRLTDWVH